ncbi:MAG: hypothetical protein ABSH50_32120 [Bryobacteraceae bacterium]
MAELAILAQRLSQFAGDDSQFSFDPAWGEIAGAAGLLLVALRSVVVAAADSAVLVPQCIALLEQPRAKEKIDAYYCHVLRATSSARQQYALAQSARIQSNAVGLLRAARDADTGAIWSDWLRRPGRTSPSMKVPIAGHCAGAGFLAELQLYSIASTPPVAVEHPELALEPLGAQLMEAVGEQARTKGISFMWHIVVRDELGAQLAPLDGDSLGAALAAGVELMSRRLTYNPGCLLIGRVLEDQRLGRTGYEREKLVRARSAAFTRIGVALDSGISDTEIEAMKPVVVRRLGTIRDAVEFAALRKPVPYL